LIGTRLELHPAQNSLPLTMLNSPDYREQFYGKYVTAFKKHTLGVPDIDKAYGKIFPLIADWVAGIERSAPIADLGCGDGRLLGVLQRMGFTRLSGCDLSQEQIELARREYAGVVHASIVAFLREQPDGHFALLTLFDVIEHMTKSEILELFELIHAKLCSGGILLGHAPNGDSPFVASVFAADFTHETLLNPMSAAALARLFGFDEFQAREHLGASRNVAGRMRAMAWQIIRLGIKLFNLIETGGVGSGIFTRNFVFHMKRAS
jgi:SAM-dependent methyltransferase